MLGRGSSGSGSPQELDTGGLLAVSGTTLTGLAGIHYVHPALTTGSFMSASTNAIALTTSSTASDRLDFMPFIPTRNITVNELAIEVTTAVAATNSRIGIYDATAAGAPNSLLTGAGTLLDSSTVGVKTSAVSPSVTLTAGTLYYLAILSNGAPTLRGIPLSACVPIGSPASGTAISSLLRATSTFASGLPTTAPAATATSTIPVWIRLTIA